MTDVVQAKAPRETLKCNLTLAELETLVKIVGGHQLDKEDSVDDCGWLALQDWIIVTTAKDRDEPVAEDSRDFPEDVQQCYHPLEDDVVELELMAKDEVYLHANSGTVPSVNFHVAVTIPEGCDRVAELKEALGEG